MYEAFVHAGALCPEDGAVKLTPEQKAAWIKQQKQQQQKQQQQKQQKQQRTAFNA